MVITILFLLLITSSFSLDDDDEQCLRYFKSSFPDPEGHLRSWKGNKNAGKKMQEVAERKILKTLDKMRGENRRYYKLFIYSKIVIQKIILGVDVDSKESRCK